MEAATIPEDTLYAWAWWNRRRLAYNAALVLAGFGAFIAFLAIGWTCMPRLGPEFEITAFTTFLQGIGYLIAIVLANVAYCAGPIFETIIPAERISIYRKTSFWLGLWFSVGLPFCIPLLLGIMCGFAGHGGSLEGSPAH